MLKSSNSFYIKDIVPWGLKLGHTRNLLNVQKHLTRHLIWGERPGHPHRETKIYEFAQVIFIFKINSLKHKNI